MKKLELDLKCLHRPRYWTNILSYIISLLSECLFSCTALGCILACQAWVSVWRYGFWSRPQILFETTYCRESNPEHSVNIRCDFWQMGILDSPIIDTNATIETIWDVKGRHLKRIIHDGSPKSLIRRFDNPLAPKYMGNPYMEKLH